MIDSIAIGVSGMRAQQEVVETLSANIANVNTPAYKRVEPRLRAVGFSAMVNDDVAAQAPGMGGVRYDEPRRLMDSGVLKKTDRALDLAIRGNGFFALTRPDGSVVYSRNGDFRADEEGFLVDANGYRLNPELQIPRDAAGVRIDAEGKVFASRNQKEELLGQIELSRFAAPEHLACDTGGVYHQTEASGEAESLAIADGGVGTVAQGFLETSNVKIVDEFVSLVVAQRAYEASAKMVQAVDEMASLANGLLRGS